MSAQMSCPHCRGAIPVTAADIGYSVTCPGCHRVSVASAADIATPATSGSLGRWLFLGASLMVLGGVLTWAGLEAMKRPQPIAQPNPPPQIASGPTTTPEQPEPVPAQPPEPPPNPPMEEPAPLPPSDAGSIEVLPAPREVARRPDAPPRPEPPPVRPPVTPPVEAVVPRATFPPSSGRLAKRIDRRTTDELLRTLATVREISLDTPTAPRTSAGLFELARTSAAKGETYPGPMSAARDRGDLASLPFRAGADTILPRERAVARQEQSLFLRGVIRKCTVAGTTEPRLDPDRLYAELLAGDRFRGSAETVPCIQQLLQTEDATVRRIGIELLRGIDSAASTEALVRWAVFDVVVENREAALDALVNRDRAVVTAELLKYLRYPWPQVAEHAAEGLVALGCVDAVPRLAWMLGLPDPDAPFAASSEEKFPPFRREVVRVNRARNCALCHAPSLAEGDLLRAVVPDSNRPLSEPGDTCVQASSTYLEQDFSLTQPVNNPGLWPDRQLYDYLVAVRPAEGATPAGPASEESPYRQATLWALRELSGKDHGTTTDAWVSLRGDTEPVVEQYVPYIARYRLLLRHPEFYWRIHVRDYGNWLLTLTDTEWDEYLAKLRLEYGEEYARLWLISYLERLALSRDARLRELAIRRLQVICPPCAARYTRVVTAPPTVVPRPLPRPGIAPGESDIQVLLRALRNEDAATRESAAIALGKLGPMPVEVHEALAVATTDRVARVRIAAAETLNSFKTIFDSACPALAKALVGKRDWDSVEQKARFYEIVLWLLTNRGRGARAAYPQLVRIASGADESEVTPANLAKLFQVIGPPPEASLEEVITLLGHQQYRDAAMAALLAAGEPAVPPLIKALKTEREPVRILAAELLGQLASLKRTPPVTRNTWRAASDALAEAKTADKSVDVRLAATKALTELNRTR